MEKKRRPRVLPSQGRRGHFRPECEGRSRWSWEWTAQPDAGLGRAGARPWDLLGACFWLASLAVDPLAPGTRPIAAGDLHAAARSFDVSASCGIKLMRQFETTEWILCQRRVAPQAARGRVAMPRQSTVAWPWRSAYATTTTRIF